MELTLACTKNGLLVTAPIMDQVESAAAPVHWLVVVLCLQLELAVKGSGKGAGKNPITGDFFIFVADLCPECKTGDIDLAANGDGRWKVEIQAVQCPVGSTSLQYQFQGSNPWYLKLQVRNHRVPVKRLELYQPGSGKWNAMKLTPDGFWIFNESLNNEKPVKNSIRIRLTSVNDKIVTDSIQSLVNDKVLNGAGQQFPLDNNLPSA